jgi:hypothetical protein
MVSRLLSGRVGVQATVASWGVGGWRGEVRIRESRECLTVTGAVHRLHFRKSLEMQYRPD